MLKYTPNVRNLWLDWSNPFNAKLHTCLLFLEGKGNVVQNHATLGVNATASDPVWIMNRWMPGIQTSGDKLWSLPNITNIVAADFTVRMCVHVLTLPTSNITLLDKSTAASTREILFCLDSDATTGSITIGRTNSTPDLATGITNNNTYDIVLTRSGSTCTLYVNGTSVGTFTNAGATATATANLVIGGGLAGVGLPTFDGYFHSIEMWTRNLAGDEVKELYHKGLYYSGLDPMRFVNPNKQKLFLPLDAAEFVETIGIIKDLNKTVSETIVASETVSRTGSYNIGVNEEVYANETFVRGSVINIDVSEGVNLNYMGGNYKSKTVSETLSVAENLKKGLWIQESITLTEDTDKSNSLVTSEGTTFSEVVSMTKVKNLSISEGVDVADVAIGYFATRAELNSGTNEFEGEVG